MFNSNSISVIWKFLCLETSRGKKKAFYSWSSAFQQETGVQPLKKLFFFFLPWYKFCHCALIDSYPTVYKQSTGCPKSPFHTPSSISTLSGFALNKIPFHFAPGCHVSSNRDRKAMVSVRQILIFSPHPFGGTRHSKQTLPQNLAT